MSLIAAAIAGSAVVGAGASIYGSITASQAQQQAEQQAISTEQQMVSPFANTGQQAGNTLLSLLTPGANQTSTLNQIPGFQFLQDWGQKGVTAQATTRGLGGNALAAGSQFATGTAQQGFNSIVSPLLQLFSSGSGAASNAANAIGSAQVGIGNAQAGQAAGIAGGVTGAANNISSAAILNALSGGKLFGSMYGVNSGTIGGTAVPGLLPGMAASDSAMY